MGFSIDSEISNSWFVFWDLLVSSDILWYKIPFFDGRYNQE
jgi:hypothetical protein